MTQHQISDDETSWCQPPHCETCTAESEWDKLCNLPFGEGGHTSQIRMFAESLWTVSAQKKNAENVSSFLLKWLPVYRDSFQSGLIPANPMWETFNPSPANFRHILSFWNTLKIQKQQNQEWSLLSKMNQVCGLCNMSSWEQYLGFINNQILIWITRPAKCI